MKNLAASIHARLAQRRAKTGEDFNVLLVRFTLERLLYRLSRSQYREQFILKGAMLFALWDHRHAKRDGAQAGRVHRPEHRSTPGMQF